MLSVYSMTAHVARRVPSLLRHAHACVTPWDVRTHGVYAVEMMSAHGGRLHRSSSTSACAPLVRGIAHMMSSEYMDELWVSVQFVLVQMGMIFGMPDWTAIYKEPERSEEGPWKSL